MENYFSTMKVAVFLSHQKAAWISELNNDFDNHHERIGLTTHTALPNEKKQLTHSWPTVKVNTNKQPT